MNTHRAVDSQPANDIRLVAGDGSSVAGGVLVARRKGVAEAIFANADGLVSGIAGADHGAVFAYHPRFAITKVDRDAALASGVIRLAARPKFACRIIDQSIAGLSRCSFDVGIRLTAETKDALKCFAEAGLDLSIGGYSWDGKFPLELSIPSIEPVVLVVSACDAAAPLNRRMWDQVEVAVPDPASATLVDVAFGFPLPEKFGDCVVLVKARYREDLPFDVELAWSPLGGLGSATTGGFGATASGVTNHDAVLNLHGMPYGEYRVTARIEGVGVFATRRFDYGGEAERRVEVPDEFVRYRIRVAPSPVPDAPIEVTVSDEDGKVIYSGSEGENAPYLNRNARYGVQAVTVGGVTFGTRMARIDTATSSEVVVEGWHRLCPVSLLVNRATLGLPLGAHVALEIRDESTTQTWRTPHSGTASTFGPYYLPPGNHSVRYVERRGAGTWKTFKVDDVGAVPVFVRVD